MDKKYSYLLLALGVVLFSCSPNYYIPNTQNVPVIKAQGEGNVKVAGNANQLELQGAYGLSQNLAIQVNTGFFIPKDEENGNGGSGNLFEAGLGFYKNLNPNLLFDVYGLLGFGNMKNYFPSTVDANPSTTGDISANLMRYGIQPGLTFHTPYFSISGSSRFAQLNYSNIQGSLIFDNTNQVNYLQDNKSNFLIEPALTIRGGPEKLKFQFQLMKSLNVSNNNFRQDEALLTLGMSYHF